MTVAALPAVAEYLEDGVTTSFPAPFRFKAAADLVVERILDSGLVTLAIGVDYTVTGGETDAGGAVKRTAATNGARLRIRRETARAQPMVYTTGDRFPAVSHEEALDRQMLIAQEQAADISDLDSRALTVPPGEVAPMLPPLSERIGGSKKVLAVNQETGALQVEPIGTTFKGDPGSADSVVDTLAQLKASPVSDTTRIWQGVPFLWKTDAGPYISDETFPYITTVESDHEPLTVGAWVRQTAGSLSAQRAGLLDNIKAIIRDAQTEFSESVKFTQFAVPGEPTGRGNIAWDTQAMNRCVAFAMKNSRVVEIPVNTPVSGSPLLVPDPFMFSNIVLPKNEIGPDGDVARPAKLTICGSGTVLFADPGILFDCAEGAFYDLVIAGNLRFEAAAALNSKFINGEKFIRLFLNPGLQINKFRWGVYCEDTGAIGSKYLQTLRVMGVIWRGQSGLDGFGAFIKAPMGYDTRVTHNIVEFGADGIVVDGQGAPALNVCTLSDNVIEGMGGRGIVAGAGLALRINGNYMEGNLGGEIFLNASTQSHIGIIVQSNGLQAHPARIAAGKYSIVWGPSLTGTALAGGNYSTGNLHDLTGASGLLIAVGDTVAQGSNVVRPGIGRYVTTNAFTYVFNWFGQSVWLDPYLQEMAFYDRFAFEGEPVVRTHGTNSPGNDAIQFARKKWAKGSQVDSVVAANTGDAIGWICTVSGSPGSWKPIGLMP